MDPRASVAAIRFGLGKRPGEAIPAEPAAWLERRIAPPAPLRPLPGLAAPLDLGQASALFDRTLTAGPGDPSVRRAMMAASRADAAAWMGQCLMSEAPFQDRLTNFWANHFTVSRRVGNAAIFIGPMLREAIRPNLFGRFEDMLIAVARHPAMLIYLSNPRSVGPNSQAAMRGPARGGGQRGLNENLAREILELHTLSPAGGYSQSDVTEFARVLTGWGFERSGGGGFRFRPALHEPGEKTLLRRRLPEGEEGGLAALRMLARHPGTARHVATKLARHFTSDAPPGGAVARLEAAFRDSGGDLAVVSRALVKLPQAWAPPLSKVRDPIDYVLGVGRAFGLLPEAAPYLMQAAFEFGQPLWSAPQPNGWPDVAEEWAQPEALLHRIQWANAVAGRATTIVRDPRGFAEAALGPLVSPETLREAGRAGSVQDALTLILVSPEFQRR